MAEYFEHKMMTLVLHLAYKRRREQWMSFTVCCENCEYTTRVEAAHTDDDDDDVDSSQLQLPGLVKVDDGLEEDSRMLHADAAASPQSLLQLQPEPSAGLSCLSSAFSSVNVTYCAASE